MQTPLSYRHREITEDDLVFLWQPALMGMTTGGGQDSTTHAVNRSLDEVPGSALVKDFRQRLLQVA